jgi:hypothetical protein
MSDWLLFNVKWAKFQLYHDENKLLLMRWWWCLLCNNMLSWILMVLVQWNISLWVDMSHHSDILFWFRANKLIPFYATCLEEKQPIRIIFFSLTRQANKLRITSQIRFPLSEMMWSLKIILCESLVHIIIV